MECGGDGVKVWGEYGAIKIETQIMGKRRELNRYGEDGTSEDGWNSLKQSDAISATFNGGSFESLRGNIMRFIIIIVNLLRRPSQGLSGAPYRRKILETQNM